MESQSPRPRRFGLRRIKGSNGMKDPCPPIFSPYPSLGESGGTTSFSRFDDRRLQGRGQRRGLEKPRVRRGENSYGNATSGETDEAAVQPGSGGGENDRHLPRRPNRQSTTQLHRPGPPTLARPRRPLGKAGEGRAREGSQDAGRGAGRGGERSPRKQKGREKARLTRHEGQ